MAVQPALVFYESRRDRNERRGYQVDDVNTSELLKPAIRFVLSVLHRLPWRTKMVTVDC